MTKNAANTRVMGQMRIPRQSAAGIKIIVAKHTTVVICPATRSQEHGILAVVIDAG
jgi:hypothetical protein